MASPSSAPERATNRLRMSMQQSVFAGENQALHLVGSSEALESVFESLIRTVEADVDDQAVASILLLDGDGKRLRHGAAPSLPDSYNSAIDGIEIGPHVGTCGKAAYDNAVVVTVDIQSDPDWQKFKELPLALGLRAAWSMPIRSADGQVLGTFGTYFRECRAPTPTERELVGILSKAAAVAVERCRNELSLRESEKFLQGVIDASADCIAVLDLEGNLQWMSNNGLGAMEASDPQQICGQDWLSLWPLEAERHKAWQALATALRGEVARFQGIGPTLRGSLRWWDVVVSLIPGDDGKPHSLLSVSRDITESKKAEQAARMAEEILQRTLAEMESRVEHRTVELAATNSLLRAEILEREGAERDRQRVVQQLASAEESERRRISRELHDEVGQHLTCLMLGLKSLRPHLQLVPLDTLRQLEVITETVGKEIHDLALELRPTALDDLGLAEALAHYLKRWSARTQIVVEYRYTRPDEKRFPISVETVIYRLVQEALTNVAKHAEARRVAIAVERCAGHVLAIVEDDGKGFDPEGYSRSEASGLGLSGMRERAANCGGTVNIESRSGKGTAVFARIPLPKAMSADV